MKRTLTIGLLAACAACASSPSSPSSPSDVPEAAPRRAALPPPPGDVPLPPPEVVSIEWCGETAAGFDGWIAAFRRHAVSQGISPELVARALGQVGYDPDVIELDRAQRHHTRSFEEFASSHVTPPRVRRGKRLLGAHAALLAKITARFGVAPEIVVAIWGLETDFGRNQGSTPSLRALVTLAYDCRRAERFRGELSSALRILQRGDLSVEEMVGAWAGELGQTQFLPSSYERFGIDFDGDGRIDLVGSTEDALGSTAHYLAEHGWRAGEGYRPGSPNFAVLSEWNKSEIYRKTIALFASKLATR
jgi:membrane-bound lytic murein transglycosylase B